MRRCQIFTLFKNKMNLFIKLSTLLIVSLFISGCMTTSPKYGKYGSASKPIEEDRIQNWKPLLTGVSLMVDINYEYHPKEMKLQNGMLLRQSDWEGYLKDYLLSRPAEERDAIIRGLSRYYTQYDKVDKIIRFEPLRYISGPYYGTSYVSARGAISGDVISANLKIQYHGSSWIFADKIKIVADDFEWKSPILKFQRDNYTEVWEYTYLDLSIPFNRFLAEKISDANETIIRFYGKQYYSDLSVTKRMKEDLKAILETIDTLGNN